MAIFNQQNQKVKNQMNIDSELRRRYDIRFYHVNTKTGEVLVGHDSGLKMNNTPMSHKEACTFKSKMMDRKGVVYRLVEV